MLMGMLLYDMYVCEFPSCLNYETLVYWCSMMNICIYGISCLFHSYFLYYNKKMSISKEHLIRHPPLCTFTKDKLPDKLQYWPTLTYFLWVYTLNVCKFIIHRYCNISSSRPLSLCLSFFNNKLLKLRDSAYCLNKWHFIVTAAYLPLWVELPVASLTGNHFIIAVR